MKRHCSQNFVLKRSDGDSIINNPKWTEVLLWTTVSYLEMQSDGNLAFLEKASLLRVGLHSAKISPHVTWSLGST